MTSTKDPQKVRSCVGFLSTATALYGRLSALEMVEYFGRLHGLDEPTLRRRIDDIFERLEMNDFRDRRCDKLSTGMKQKVSIARTLVHDPSVMIFDEPTVGLDVMAARTIAGFIRECRDHGKTVIFSTHVMSEVEKLCDHIGIIHDGKLLAEGTLAELAPAIRHAGPGRYFRQGRGAMSLRNIGIVYRKELIDSLRDRRTVISMIVVPLLAHAPAHHWHGRALREAGGPGHGRSPESHDPGRRGFPERDERSSSN